MQDGKEVSHSEVQVKAKSSLFLQFIFMLHWKCSGSSQQGGELLSLLLLPVKQNSKCPIRRIMVIGLSHLLLCG